MNMLIDIMKNVDRMGHCWWSDRTANAIINHAHRLGLVVRFSTTQVQWTERGCELARKYATR